MTVLNEPTLDLGNRKSFMAALEEQLSRALLAAGITGDELNAELRTPTTKWNQMNVLLAQGHSMGQVAALTELYTTVTGRSYEFQPKV